MPHVNVEIKARCRDPDAIRRFLRARGAEFRGLDRQTDTYFRVPSGRLKLREGRIENHLIFYQRPDQAGPKAADVLLLRTEPATPLKEILAGIFGVLIVVDKRREIFFLDNVKFHLDELDSLGSFVEIEAQAELPDGCDETARPPLLARLDDQCRSYMHALGIRDEDLLCRSYSDMLLDRQRGL